MTAETGHSFEDIRQRLKSIVSKYEGRGLRRNPSDREGDFTLVGLPTDASRGRDVWFGGVQLRKKYVSYHLMPVYVFPELLGGASAGLKKRMQGKSCFNFRRVDEQLFQELARLTEEGHRRFREAKLIV